MKIFKAIGVGLLVLLCGGCTANGIRFNFAPLIDYELNRETGSVHLSILGPIITYDSDGDQSLFAVRPLVSVYDNEAEDRSAVHVLYPLVRHRRKGLDEQFTILPIYHGQTFVTASGKADSDYMLFPFFWYGRGDNPETDNYFAFFPFYGEIKGKFGLDRLAFTAFPVYIKSETATRERTHVCWPLCSVTDSVGEEEGVTYWRSWPLYGHLAKKDKYEHRFILWPIYTEATLGLDTNHPTQSVSLFPFYAETRGEQMLNRSYLVVFSFGHDERTNYSHFAAPWPLIVFESSDDHVDNRVLPFWRYRRRDGVETYQYLFPIVTAEYAQGAGWDKSSLWVLPFFWTHHKQYDDSDQYDRFTKLWPLFAYHHDEDGTEKTAAFSLLWFKDPEGFERDWSPLWQVWNSIETPDEKSRSDFLWGFYRRVTDGENSSTDYTPLLNIETGDTSGFSLLQGLFGVKSDADGTDVQLLWFIDL